MCRHHDSGDFCWYPGQGIVQLLILRILHDEPTHGYQIMNELQKITSEKYHPEPGAIYTMLRRMDERGLVTSEWEKNETGIDRRVYTLTKEGVEFLREGLEMVKRRKHLMDNLVNFYDTQFSDKKSEDL